ncbi:MAG: 3',5'-cyclic-nucleotide phosphodiesterase [Betaproteobacteria bacterium]
MQLRVLGCSGGIGGNLRTTALLLNHDILIDAGTGVGDLSLSELRQIDHVFVTHSHLDHIACIPFLVDTVGGLRSGPITVHATAPTIAALQAHIFNWKIWPDFSQIPSPQTSYLRYQEIQLGVPTHIAGGTITPLPANHVVPAVGFHLDSGEASLVFTGDTTSNDALWELVNRIENLRYLIIETAFPNAERQLALDSKHLCPSMLAAELGKLKRAARVFITHLKPGEGTLTMEEVEQLAGDFGPRRLSNGQVFKF